MSQRIMTGISAVMAVCCLAVVGIAWSMMQRSERVNQKMLEQLAVFAERPQPVATSKVDQQIMKQLEQLNQKQTAQGATASEGMNQVSFQLVQNNQDEKPAVGFTGKFIKTGSKTDSFTLEAVSNEEGKLEFGNLPWGKYDLYLKAPWDEYSQASVTVIPGRNYLETIPCPAAAPTDVPVQFQVNWPDKLKSEDWFLLCDFRSRGNAVSSLNRKYGDNFWSGIPIPLDKQSLVFLMDNTNKVSLCPLGQNGEFIDIDLGTLVAKPSINIAEAESYILPVICLVKKQDLTKLPSLNDDQKFMVLNHKRKVLTNINPFTSPLASGGFGGPLIPTPTTVLFPFENFNSPTESRKAASYAQGIQLAKQLAFTVVKDQDNVWKIKLPELNHLKIPEGLTPVAGY